MKMKDFKFFDGHDMWVQTPLPPMLENEQRIGYWCNGYEEINYRVIAWYRTNIYWHNWRRMTYIGTMEQFFRYRLEIPVIEYITIPPSRISNRERIYHEGDGPYLSLHTFGNYRIEITYYEQV